MPHISALRARALTVSATPEQLFLREQTDQESVFWLDAGSGTRQGWSIVGSGDVESDAEAPRAIRIDAVPSRDRSRPPFAGGWIGWNDYESGAAAAGAPVDGDGRSSGAWLRVRRAVAFDHADGVLWALAPEADLDAWALEVAERCAAPAVPVIPDDAAPSLARGRHAPDEYAALIARCRDAIRAGEAYQLCLTTRFDVPGEHDPIQTYLRLRRATPAHHGGFIRIGGRSLLSASPEQFLFTDDGRIVTRPIKGTRPRSVDPAEDAALAAELLASVKERAENVMIVDLMRNDLSQVCTPGTIRVDGLWDVESYPAVHQLVSTVSGVPAPSTTVSDLFAAAFPAGSMTGAPKLSAMTILHALERGPRGVYSGCFGYIGLDGALDLAMVIRSILIDERGAHIGAGGGITWGSQPDAEVAEVAIKARAPLAALGARLPDAWIAG
ncbi:anthranilate synthase component I family protein [Microbacterium sp. NPDC056234]|uniref:anthranilate synthase component I family protein n=1 Tax=Microbacterium sp. NPDC056234 TaxID=3345757 RepID=UPI0035E04C4F